jgi:hypothetical protein
MKGAWRIIAADLWWILDGSRALVLLVLLPLLIVVLVGQLRAKVQEFSLGVAGRPAPSTSASTQLDEGLQLWEQLSSLTVSTFDEPARDPLALLREQRLDVLMNVGDVGTDCWRIYSAQTNPARAAAVRQIAASLERSVCSSRRPVATSRAPLCVRRRRARPRLLTVRIRKTLPHQRPLVSRFLPRWSASARCRRRSCGPISPLP